MSKQNKWPKPHLPFSDMEHEQDAEAIEVAKAKAEAKRQRKAEKKARDFLRSQKGYTEE